MRSVARLAARIAHEVANDVQDLWLPAHVDARLLQHRHQVLCELLLLRRVAVLLPAVGREPAHGGQNREAQAAHGGSSSASGGK